jgi:hypothetical protein
MSGLVANNASLVRDPLEQFSGTSTDAVRGDERLST